MSQQLVTSCDVCGVTVSPPAAHLVLSGVVDPPAVADVCSAEHGSQWVSDKLALAVADSSLSATAPAQRV